MNRTQRKKNIIQTRRTETFKRWMKGWKQPRNDLRIGDIAEGCDLHIGPIISYDPDCDDLVIKSFFNGKEGHCSARHCGVTRQTTKQVIQKLEIHKTEGMKGLERLYFSSTDYI